MRKEREPSAIFTKEQDIQLKYKNVVITFIFQIFWCLDALPNIIYGLNFFLDFILQHYRLMCLKNMHKTYFQNIV